MSMQPLARLPLFVSLAGKRALVAGESEAAAWKVELLAAAGARVDVFAPAPCDGLRTLEAASCGKVILHARAWRPGDFAGVAIAVGALDDDNEAQAFANAACKAHVPVNVVDKPAYCDFFFGAIVNRSPLVVGISTDGAAPALAQAIRAKLEAVLPKGLSHWAALAQRWRARVASSGLDFGLRRAFWQRFAALALKQPEHPPREEMLAEFLAECGGDALGEQPAMRQGV